MYNNDLTSVTTDIILNNGGSGTVHFVHDNIGNVFVSFSSIQCNSAAVTEVGTVSADLVPQYPCYIKLGRYNDSATHGYLAIDSTGKIYIKTDITGANLTGSAYYRF